MEGVDRDTFIQENMGLVGMVANRFLKTIEGNPTLDRDDLVNIGAIGLIEAYDRFDPSYDVKFSTYAVPMIVGSIKRFFRDHLDSIKFSRKSKSDCYTILKANLLGEKPAIISQLLDMPLENVENALAYYKYKYTDSLDQVIYEDDGNPITLAGKVGTEINMDSNIELESLLRQFDERTQKIIKLRLQDLSQSEIAKVIGVSQVTISRILTKVQKEIKGGIEVTESNKKKPDFNLAVKLAKETNLTGYAIHQQTGVSRATAYKYISQYRTTKEEIEEVKKRVEGKKTPVKTYNLSSEELEKYRLDKPDYNPLDNPPPRPHELIETTVKVDKPKVEAESTNGQPAIIKEKPVEKIKTPKVDNGSLTLTLKLDANSVGVQLESIVKAMRMLGFKELDITIKSQQVA